MTERARAALSRAQLQQKQAAAQDALMQRRRDLKRDIDELCERYAQVNKEIVALGATTSQSEASLRADAERAAKLEAARVPAIVRSDLAQEAARRGWRVAFGR